MKINMMLTVYYKTARKLIIIIIKFTTNKTKILIRIVMVELLMI